MAGFMVRSPGVAGSAEHLIEAEGVRCALRAGVAAVVVPNPSDRRFSDG